MRAFLCINPQTKDLWQFSGLSALKASASERRNRYFSLSICSGDSEYFSSWSSTVERSLYECEWDKKQIFLFFLMLMARRFFIYCQK